MSKYFSSTIQKGSEGDDVKEWQTYLNTLGYGLTVDGIFGDKTHRATIGYQTNHGLTADGIVGEKTWGQAGYTPYSTLTTPVAKPTIEAAPTQPTLNTTATDLPTTNTTSWDDSTKGQAAGEAYGTAKGDLNGYGDFDENDYDSVTSAGTALDTHNANKPGKYQSQWQSQLDELMNSILNREKFSYDLNGDALYQQYKDKYIQQGKLAMGDAIGQASAMTGGYGNSYAQSVGQQQYQASLDNLNDIVPQLYQMALDKYNMEGQELYNQYGLVADRDSTDYGRYRDTVSDWYTDRDYLTGRYDTEWNKAHTLYQEGYQQLLDKLGIAQSDYYDGANMYYTEQSNKNTEAWNKYNAAETARRDENSLIQQNWQNEFNVWDANNDNAWESAKWDEAARQYANEEYWREKNWKLTNEQWDWQKEQASKSSVVGTTGSTVMYENDGSLKEGYTTTNAAFFDENGNFKKATLSTNDDKGNAIWYIDGKEVVRRQGANPYTGGINSDVLDKNGNYDSSKAWPNTPYQPNNINGKPLSKSGITDYVNGVKQNVWKTPDGQLWIWDGTKNEYERYTE